MRNLINSCCRYTRLSQTPSLLSLFISRNETAGLRSDLMAWYKLLPPRGPRFLMQWLPADPGAPDAMQTPKVKCDTVYHAYRQNNRHQIPPKMRRYGCKGDWGSRKYKTANTAQPEHCISPGFRPWLHIWKMARAHGRTGNSGLT